MAKNSRRNLNQFNAFLCLAILLSAWGARAVPDASFDRPQIVAVEPRAHNPRYDLTANLSLLPIDAFYKGLSYGASYTHSMTTLWSWEVVNAALNSKLDTSLKKDLLQSFNVKPQGILDSISWFALSSAIYTPLYSKHLLFNEKLIYGASSFVLGAGAIGFEGGDVIPAVGGGVILRFFHSARYSSKFDFRVYKHFSTSKSSDLMVLLTYGLSFELGDNKPLKR